MSTIQLADGFEKQKMFILPEYLIEKVIAHELIKHFYITDIGHFHKAKYHYVERIHGSDSHILIVCSDGEGYIQLQNKLPIVLKKQHYVIIPAGTPHIYQASDHNPWSLYWMHLRGSHVNEFIMNFDLACTSRSTSTSTYLKFIECFKQCYSLLEQNSFSIHHHLHASSMMRYMFSLFVTEHTGTKETLASSNYTAIAISYMQKNLNRQLTLTEIASETCLSKQHLNTIFNKQLGFAPIDFFLRLKMQYACQMLDLTTLSVKEISAQLGFQDSLYFSRIFKKTIHHSPSEYRNISKG
jgi:AraC-like DNA-binding protein